MQVTKCGEKQKDTVVNKVLLAVKVHEMTWTAPMSVPEGYEVQLVWVSVLHFTMSSQLVTYRRKKDSGNKDNFSFISSCPASHHKTSDHLKKAAKIPKLAWGGRDRKQEIWPPLMRIFWHILQGSMAPCSHTGPQLKWHRNSLWKP